MDTVFQIILTIHIIAGSLSLVIFWIPIFVKKGGNIHVKIGKIYVLFMWVVVISAFILSVLNLIKTYYISAAFLGYLSIITGHPLWYGITILKHKREVPSSVKSISKVFNWILFLGGIGLIVWSLLLKIEGQAILLLIFGIIGVVSSAPLVLSKKESKANWLSEHLEGLVVTGIAAYTAFFAFGGQTLLGNIFSGSLIFIPWVLPTVIGVVLIKRYKRKMNLVK